MAFNVDDRVQFSDQSSQWRNKYGTVEAVDGDEHQVRIDGHAVGSTVLAMTNELRPTSQPSNITY